MKSQVKDSENKQDCDCEEFRKDLFEYRVLIKSYIKNLNTIIISGTIVISVLAFFGYNKIENIQNIVLGKANLRLAQTDSILAQIDQKRIDSLNIVLNAKGLQLKETIENFERIISQNQVLESNLLKSLPENKRAHPKISSVRKDYEHKMFEVKAFNQEIAYNETVFVYAIINDDYAISDSCYFSTGIRPKNRNVLLQFKRYAIDSKVNKLSFSVDEKFENYDEYEFELGILQKEEKDYMFYYKTYPIVIK